MRAAAASQIDAVYRAIPALTEKVRKPKRIYDLSFPSASENENCRHHWAFVCHPGRIF
jgi:hypothetical protein